jgi:hypothetical protein
MKARFAKCVLWAMVITIMLAAQSYNSTKLRELRTEINKLKSERVPPVVIESKSVTKKRRVK